MKQSLTLLTIGLNSILFSQVGIQTEKPTETLHVAGAIRVDNLPNNGQVNAIYTTPLGERSNNKNQTFNATKTLVADANGVIGSVNGIPSGGVCTGNPNNVAIYKTEVNAGVTLNVLDFSNFRADDNFDCVYILKASYQSYPDRIYLPQAPIDQSKIYSLKIYIESNYVDILTSKTNSTNALMMNNPCLPQSSCNGYTFFNDRIRASQSTNIWHVITTRHFTWYNGKWNIDMN